MKAFKEWFSKNIERIYGISDQLSKGDCCKVNVEVGWRECLKEMLKRFEISHSESDIVDWIKKELGE